MSTNNTFTTSTYGTQQRRIRSEAVWSRSRTIRITFLVAAHKHSYNSAERQQNTCLNFVMPHQAIFEPPPQTDTQPGWRTFMMTCLRWILGYLRLEIWRKIGLSADCDVFAQRYALVVMHASVGRHLCAKTPLTILSAGKMFPWKKILVYTQHKQKHWHMSSASATYFPAREMRYTKTTTTEMCALCKRTHWHM